MAFIYLHEFPDGKYYVGMTETDPEQRWKDGNGYKDQKKVHDAIKKFGWDNVKHMTIKVDDVNVAQNLEGVLIRMLGTVVNGYNSTYAKRDDVFMNLVEAEALCKGLQTRVDNLVGLVQTQRKQIEILRKVATKCD